LLPGAGFDVVPSDCLANHLRRRLPEASHLTLAFAALGRASRGTTRTALLFLPRGGAIRRDGRLTPVPLGWKAREIPFEDRARSAVSIPWGDLATAWFSTGIPNIETYMAAPRRLRLFLRVIHPVRGLAARPAVRRWLERRLLGDSAGPSAAERRRGRSLLWGEVRSPDGRVATARQSGPEGYDLTVAAGLRILERILAGDVKPGYQTPATAYGADFVLELPGVARSDG